MSIKEQDLLRLLIGQEVIISGCEEASHVDCLCNMMGLTYVIEKPHDTPYSGTPTWHLKGSNKRVRLSEITLLRKSPSE